MGADGWYTLAVLALMVFALARELAGPDFILLAGLFALAVPLPLPGLEAGVLTPGETFRGFANPALATVGALFVVSAGLRDTGLLDAACARLFGGARGMRATLLRMCPPLAALSGFLNNAPIVAMMTPAIMEWARRRGISPSKFLIPLSYSTIFGSLLTVIGTSVNLTVSGLMSAAGMRPMGFFELLPVGLPVALAGIAYLVLRAPNALPARREVGENLGARRREYTAAMRVAPGGRLVGETVESAGLRNLPGLFLFEIERRGATITPVGPDARIEAEDRLVFVGVVSTIVDLQRIPGLTAELSGGEDAGEKEAAPTGDDAARRLVEAVVAPSSPLVGRSIRGANFRTKYDAAVVAVHRNGERVSGKIGEIVLRPGDTLLLQSAPGFHRAHRNSPDFYLVSEVPGGEARREGKRAIALLILAAMVLASAAGGAPISVMAFLAAGALLATRCMDGASARRAVDGSVLIVIGAGFGVAFALQKTGAAHFVAGGLVALGGAAGASGAAEVMVTLALVYAVTLVLAETLHHAAAAAIMVPIAAAAAADVGADPRAFILTCAIAANCSFANPVTYQTHLIVYGPGAYRFTDFVRFGLPLDLLCAAAALAGIHWLWL